MGALLILNVLVLDQRSPAEPQTNLRPHQTSPMRAVRPPVPAFTLFRGTRLDLLGARAQTTQGER